MTAPSLDYFAPQSIFVSFVSFVFFVVKSQFLSWPRVAGLFR
jgi:hypothetical protein